MSPPLTVEEARARIMGAARPRPTELLDLAFAAGRVLAAPVTAKLDQPPFRSAAMDGYAVRDADVRASPARLTVVGEAPAGRAFDGVVGRGEAVRIFTGAVVPDGADRVVIQEETVRVGDTVAVTAPQDGGSNIRATRLDFSAGDRLLPRGTRMEGAALALAAAGNAGQVEVFRPPIVGVLATGDELVEPGVEPGPSQIISSTPYALVERIAAWGGQPIALGIARDDADAIAEAIDTPGFDIVVPIGGASVGEHDLVKSALTARGLLIDFERVAMKPGKPTWFGTMGARLVVGLPGNPASALVAAQLFLKPLIYQMTGRHPSEAVRLLPARLDAPLPRGGPRESYLRAHLGADRDGVLAARPETNQDSSLMTPFARANALIRRSINAPPAAAGEIVAAMPLFEGL
ncbi:MAG: molybdopterin molybdotransferase MoeA [Caulobacterales bacterium]|nr:molybdopterin molybdotransferase MoeA [Caulobacterales bacterium]